MQQYCMMRMILIVELCQYITTKVLGKGVESCFFELLSYRLLSLINLQHIFLGRDVPSRAAFSVIRPTIGKQQIADKGKAAMQGYLNHFLGNLDIVNSREVKSEN